MNGYAQFSTRIEDIERKIKNTTSDTNRVDLLNSLYDEVVRTNPLRAKIYAEDALKIAQRINYIQGLVASTEKIADNYYSQGAYSKAIAFYEQALKLRKQANQLEQTATIYNKIGRIHIQQANTRQAFECFQNAIEIYEQKQNAQGIAITRSNIAQALYKEQAYEKAIEKYREALVLADSLKDKSLIARNLLAMADIHYVQKKYEDAEQMFKQLLQISLLNGMHVEELKAYDGLSNIASIKGEYKKAYEYFRNYVRIIETYFYKKEKEKDNEISKTQKHLLDGVEQRKKADEQATQNNLRAYALGIVSLILFGTLVFAIRSNRSTRKINRLLEQQNNEIANKNKILEEQKSKIELQSEAINRKNETQEATFREIERKNKDITSSINYAKRIQESILPTDAKISEALPEHFVFFRPRDIVSGDFYWFLHRDGKIIIAALDCTGHGVPGAIMSMLGDSYLNQIIKLQGITDPQLILDNLHLNIGVALNQEETQNQDGMDIAICVIDPAQKTMAFAGAGRTLLLIQDNKMEAIESCKLPVGGFQRDRERVFEKHVVNLNQPTWFYIYSDGFQDQFGGIKGRKFAKNRLEELLFELHPKSLHEQKKLLNKTLVEWMGENRQMDDILIIGAKLEY